MRRLGYGMMWDAAAAEIGAPPASRWTARQSVTRLLTLDYCVATTNGARKNTFAVRWPLCPAENEQARVAGSLVGGGNCQRQLLPQCSSQLECDKSQRNK